MAGRVQQRWRAATWAIAAGTFLLGTLLPVAWGTYVAPLSNFGVFSASIHAFSWGLAGSGYQDAAPWIGSEAPLLHAWAFLIWVLIMVLVAASLVRGLTDATRRTFLLAAAVCSVVAPLLHVFALREWLSGVTPGLGLVFQLATAMALVLLAIRLAEAPSESASLAG